MGDFFDPIGDFLDDAVDWVVDAVNTVVDFVSDIFAPPLSKEPNLGSFSSVGQTRIRQIRQAIASHRFIYGEFRISGPLTFIEVTNSNAKLHMIITLASHPVEAIEDIYFDDTVIPSDAIDPTTGVVLSGRFAGKARIFKSLGDEGSTQPFPALVSATTSWTNDHLQRGRAKIYLTLDYDVAVYPTQIPAISAWVKGKKLSDPRNASTIAWSPNPSLVIRDYMMTSTVDGGGGATGVEFDDTFTISSANNCDEIVSTARIDTRLITSTLRVDTSYNYATLVGSTLEVFTGDRVIVSAQTSSIGGLTAGTAYYVIAKQRQDTPRIQFASTYALAIAGTAKTLTSQGEGTISVVKTGEPRYTMNGLMQIDRKPVDMLVDALTSMAGRLVYAGGKWKIRAGVYTAPTITLDENDFISGLSIQTKPGRRTRFNAVKGVYVTSLNLDQPADYPPVTNSVYESEDNNERVFREVNLPNTNRPNMAKRLAKIVLEGHRQGITFTGVTNLKGLQLQAGDTVSIDNERMGWSAKVFEVASWKLISTSGEGAQSLGCEMSFRETATTVFDWNSGEETVVDPAPNSILPDPFIVQQPQNITVSETIYDTRGSAGVKVRSTIAWAHPGDSSIKEFEVQKQQTFDKDGNAVSEDYHTLGRTPDVFMDVEDVAPGIYNFRVRSINFLEVPSEWTTKSSKEIFGLLDPPIEPQNLTISAIGGLALLRWDVSPDLDVIVGGTYVVRHDRATVGAGWGTSVRIGAAIAGADTTATLPLKSGTYLIKAVDSSGIESTNPAAVTTKQATVAAYTSTSTITESTVFPGSTTNLVATGGVLKLVGSGLVDEIVDVSSISDWDSTGGVANSGSYIFGSAFDWGSVLSKRYTTDLAVLISNVNDLLDDRTSNIDDWASFDGDYTSAVDVRVYSAETDDDPTGSPVWASWQLLDSAELTARAVKFKVEFVNSDPAFNAEVSLLSVVAETLA